MEPFAHFYQILRTVPVPGLCYYNVPGYTYADLDVFSATIAPFYYMDAQMKGAAALLFCLALPLGTWAAITPTDYEQTKALTSSYTAHWKIEAGTFHLGIEAEISGATGWIGFGFSEAGGMPGADIVYFETGKPDSVTDAWALAYSHPAIDDCNDWTFVSGGVENGKIFVEATRPLNTGDPQDWELVDDSNTRNGHQIIAAWGISETISWHGQDNVKADAAHLFQNKPNPLVALQQNMPNVQSVDIVHSDFAIPDDVITTYEYWCVNLADLLGLDGNTPVHVVAVEPIIDPDTAPYVHHFTVDGFHGTGQTATDIHLPSESYRQVGTRCRHIGAGDGAKMYAWTPGNEALVFPADTGLRVLGDGFRSIMIDTHYDNPSRTAGLLDSSGIRLWYSTELQANDIGVMQIGDPQVALRGAQGGMFAALPAGISKYSFSCTRMTQGFAEGVSEVSVFASLLHMHDKGQRMVSRVLNSDGEVVRTDQVQVYDFDQNGMIDPISVGGGFKLRRGDWFEIDCYYTVGEGEAVVFGQGSQEEMCISYVYYFPAQPLPNSGDCNVDLDGYSETGALFHLSETLTDYERVFATSCKNTGFDATGTLPFESECNGVSACVAAQGSQPTTCTELEDMLGGINGCFESNGCCDRWQYAVEIWQGLEGLGGCDYTPTGSTCGAKQRKRTPADLICPQAVTCVEELGLPTTCDAVDDAWRQASAACFADEGCCDLYPYFLENWLYSSPALQSAGCGFLAGEWGGGCIRSQCADAVSCVETLGLPAQCSDVDDTWKATATSCFADEECCDVLDSYLNQAVVSLPELASCDLDASDLQSSTCNPPEWAWTFDIEQAFSCDGLSGCVAGVYNDLPAACAFLQEIHRCFDDTGCCVAWPAVVSSSDVRNGQCDCAGDFGTFCGTGPEYEGSPGWRCSCSDQIAIDQCVAAQAPSWVNDCPTAEANMDALRGCFEASECCEAWSDWTGLDIPEFLPHLTTCGWGEPTCTPHPELPLAACGGSLEDCLDTAAGGAAPSSCADIEALKDEVAGCFAERSCCGSWSDATDYFDFAFSLSGCDYAVTCVDAELKVAAFDVTLPMAETDFTQAARANYIKSCSDVGGVPESSVVIKAVTATTRRRRLLADGIVVATEMDVPASTTPTVLTQAMEANLNTVLQTNGLPASSSIGTVAVEDKPTVATTTPSPGTGGAGKATTSTAFMGAAALLLALLCLWGV